MSMIVALTLNKADDLPARLNYLFLSRFFFFYKNFLLIFGYFLLMHQLLVMN